MCLISGTASKLNRSGWEVVHLFIPNQDKDRNKAHLKAASLVLDSVLYMPLKNVDVRNDLEEVEYSWAAVPREKFPEIYNYPAVKTALIKMVNDFSPSVIFTLDNEIGGYGHPDHVFISQLVLDLAQEQMIPAEYIYQSVMTDHMEKSIIDERHSRRMRSWGYDGEGWIQAKEIYRVEGMPEPDVEINIASEAVNKMAFLRSYNERERKTLGFFIPAFEDYEAEEYFMIFDREFFRVVKID
jgi:LmbE family N-acetylglucosaminyl deacetylase